MSRSSPGRYAAFDFAKKRLHGALYGGKLWHAWPKIGSRARAVETTGGTLTDEQRRFRDHGSAVERRGELIAERSYHFFRLPRSGARMRRDP